MCAHSVNNIGQQYLLWARLKWLHSIIASYKFLLVLLYASTFFRLSLLSGLLMFAFSVYTQWHCCGMGVYVLFWYFSREPHSQTITKPCKEERTRKIKKYDTQNKPEWFERCWWMMVMAMKERAKHPFTQTFTHTYAHIYMTCSSAV